MRARAVIAFAAIAAFSSVLGAESTQTSTAATEGPAVNTSPGVPTNSKATKSKQSASAANNTSDAASGKTNSNRADRLNLETTVVTGNRELPKVLYIVPWKKGKRDGDFTVFYGR